MKNSNDFDSTSDSSEVKGIGEITKKRLKELIENLQETEQFLSTRSQTSDNLPLNSSDKSKSNETIENDVNIESDVNKENKLSVPEEENFLGLDSAGIEDEDIINANGVTTKRIKALWDKLKIQLMKDGNSDTASEDPMISSQKQEIDTTKDNPKQSVPLEKSKIELSEQEKAKLRAFRGLK